MMADLYVITSLQPPSFPNPCIQVLALSQAWEEAGQPNRGMEGLPSHRRKLSSPLSWCRDSKRRVQSSFPGWLPRDGGNERTGRPSPP